MQAAQTSRVAPDGRRVSSVAACSTTASDAALEALSLEAASMSHGNLEAIYEDLLDRLDEGMFTDRRKFIDDYLAAMVKHDEMTTLWTDPAFYTQLKRAIVEEFLPLHDKYSALKEKEEKKLERGSWPKYCLWVIGICLGIELVISEGRVLRPQLLLPAVILDGLLGFGLWYLMNFRTLANLRRIHRGLRNSVHDLAARQRVSERYEVFRTYSGGDLLKAELQQLLASYAAPAEFWRDYYLVRRADPTTPQALNELGIDRFNGFLELHTNGTYSEEARQQRFDALFLVAHKSFMLADSKNYVLDNLSRSTKTKPV
jgi:hypothetical protein